MFPDFSKLPLDPGGRTTQTVAAQDCWRRAFEAETERPIGSRLWHTAEGIDIKPLYSAADLEELTHLAGMPGFPPYLRGPYPGMYRVRPWSIRQQSGAGTAEASNRIFRQSLAEGQTGLSIAFDLPTHRGYDSDHSRVARDVGVAGVAVDSILDFRALFEAIPLDQVSISMTMNGAVLPVLAGYIVAAEEQGVTPERLMGTIQNDILKEFMVRNTYIYPPAPSMRIVSDIFRFTALRMPRFNAISISGYHMQDAGAPADLELAYTLADGLEYVRAGLAQGLSIDSFAPRMSFFWASGMNFFMEVAKLRAARMLWANLMAPFGPKDPASMALRCHVQTSAWSLAGRDVLNNVTRTCLEAMAATQGHTQSLHTAAFDETLGRSSAFAARLARDTQLVLKQESGTCRVIDPWAGSFYVERLTQELARRTWMHISEIEAMGGMAKAIAEGLPRRRIEEASARAQARLDAGQETLVGVNKYRLEEPEPVALDPPDNARVRRHQIDRLRRLRAERDAAVCQAALDRLGEAASNGAGNLLALAVDAIRAKATVGEISNALENVFGRHRVDSFCVRGAYATTARKASDRFARVRARVEEFGVRDGRPPRIMVARIGQDGHDRDQKVIASAFADLGFDVDLGPLFQTPAETVRQAVEHDCHIIGASAQAPGHLALIPELRRELRKLGADDMMIAVGGPISPKDFDALMKAGAAAILPPAGLATTAANDLIQKLNQRRGYDRKEQVADHPN